MCVELEASREWEWGRGLPARSLREPRSVQKSNSYPYKTGYRFIVRGESLRLSDVKVWQAEKTTAAAK